MDDLSQRLAKLSPKQRAALEARLEEQRKQTPSASLPIPVHSRAEPAMLSFAQERLWFLEQLEGASATYNVCFALRLRGLLQIKCLERALMEILGRHESLRTTFEVDDQKQIPVQRIASMPEFRLELVEVPPGIEKEREACMRELVDAAARKPMALAIGPLFRARLISLGADHHVLVLVAHHIISDGASFEVIFRELAILYGDFVTGRDSSLKPLEIQYVDFAEWQRKELRGEDLQRHLVYWRQRLAGAPPVLELPTSFPRPAEQSYRGSTCERTVPAELIDKLRQFSAENAGSLFMTVLAAFDVLMSRYSGKNDILIGSPVSNRTRVEFEPVVGFFVNMLVLRTELSGDPTVRELVRRVRQTTLEAFSHQDIPFEQLVREAQLERNLSHPPFFQVALMFQEDLRSSLKFPGLSWEPVSINQGIAKYDLTLYATESQDGLQLCLEYATDLFKAELAERLLSHFVALLESFLANVDGPISQLNFLSAAERQQLIFDWNQTAMDYPREKTVHALFEEQAERSPRAIAVECEGRRLCYEELDRNANALADELRSAGVEPNDRVGLYIDRSVEMMIGLFGILKAGAAYVPLDPSFPKDRLAFIIADAQIPVLVTESRFVEELPEHHGKVILLDQLKPAAGSRKNIRSADSSSCAYVLYTSGSTGRPKGVQISHRAFANFLHSMRQAPGMAGNDVMLAVTTLSFDIAGLELMLPLIAGAKVVVAPRESAADGQRLARLIAESRATIMQATPVTWRMLIDSGWQGDKALKILCGGEAVDQDLCQRLLSRCRELWNMYGPTETTVWSTIEQILPGQAITIGRPIANTKVYIVDQKLQPVPIGVVGEILIGGDGIAIGYLNRPDLTAERLLPDPFDSNGGGRVYRTGDLGRYCSDGRIEFLGRADNQIKLRGFRIELGEIEGVLSQCDGVKQAVVIIRDDTPGQKRLVAYLVPKSDEISNVPGAVSDRIAVESRSSAFDSAALRAKLRLSLPEYMIPSVFMVIETLPLTPNGKVDRKALPQPESSGASEKAYEEPRGETEQRLATIMANVLKVPRVGREDSFFDLGGHSILAVTFFNEIDRAFGQRLPLATLFRAPTIEHIAETLRSEQDRPKEWASLVPIQTKGSKPRFFCVHGAGGNLLIYRDLARHFRAEYPFYGLQSQGLDGTASPLATVEEMAKRYVREIREIQPTGPYCIGGYCLGGTVAYEIAQILRSEGCEVGLVALLDTYNFSRMEQPRLLNYLQQRVRFHLSNLAHLRPGNWVGYLSNKMRTARDGELSAIWKALTGSFRSNGAGPAKNSIEASVQEMNDLAAGRYRPRPYGGRVTVFKPHVNYDFFPDPLMGWSELVGENLEIVELPVNPHAMLIEPYVGELASELQRRLDEFDRSADLLPLGTAPI